MALAVRLRMVLLVTIIGATTLAAAASAPAAPVAVSAMSITIDMDRSGGDLLSVASKGCIEIGAPLDWHTTHPTKPFRHTVEFSGNPHLVTGTLDVGARSATAAGGGIALEAATTTGRPIAIADVGIQVSGSTAYVIGWVGTGQPPRTHPARVKLIRIAPYTVHQGPLTDRHGRPIEDSLFVGISGRATLGAGLVGPLNHLRCRHGGSRALRAGLPVGSVTANLFPDGATSSGGTIALVNVAAVTEDDDRSIVFGAVAPATVATSAANQSLTFPTQAPTSLSLRCDAGTNCVLASGHANLGGGFTMTAHGVVVTLTGLALDYGGPPAVPDVKLTGTLNGTPVTVISTSDLTLDADVAGDLSTAFGMRVDGQLGRLQASAASLRAP